MEISIVTDNKEFESLHDDWDKLATDTTNKFQWLYKWWKHLGKNKELNILVMRRNNAIIGIAPLYIENTKALKFIPFRKVCSLGDDMSNCLNFFVDENEDKETIFKYFLDYIFENISFDALELRHINSVHSDLELWQRIGNNFKFDKTWCSTGIRLSKFESYQDYSDNFLKKKFRGNIRTKYNKIEKENAQMEFIFRPDVTSEDMEIIADLNIKRQQYLLYQKGNLKKDSFFAHNDKRNFLIDYFCENDKVFVAYLKIHNKISSYVLGLRDNKTLCFWSTALDMQYKDYAPSVLLYNELVRYAFDNNFEYIDLLRGEDPYKFNWINEQSLNYNINVPRSFLGKAVHFYRSNSPDVFLKMVRPSANKILGQEGGSG